MILERTQTNNGYRCGCCASGEEYAEWIEDCNKLSFKEVMAKGCDYKSNIEGDVALRYEADGKILYGYETQFGRNYTDVFIYIGDKSYLAVSEGKAKKTVSEEELLNIWKESQA